MTVSELFINIVGKDNFAKDETMSEHCTFKTGGNAKYFITPENAKQLTHCLNAAKDNNIPFVILGNGSNILVSDKGIKGLVINLSKHFSDVSVCNDEIISGAGALLSKVAILAFENSLAGFEFASGIPGSFGGAVYMNAGAYGGEMKHVLTEVTVLTPQMKIIDIPVSELELGYRTSCVKEKGYILFSGKIKLERGNKEDIKAMMNDYNCRRRDKQPLNYPSAGSTFKRPEGHFAGKLIEDSGLKGFKIGGAQVSEKHAGFVINVAGATTEDILAVIEHCKDTVFKKFGIKLQCEIRLLGEF